MRALTVALFFLSLTSIAQTTCLDPLACNFTEIGDCVYLDIDGLPCVSEGCAIPGACNFDPEADINDGSCEFTSCLGCTDETACNYEPEALYLDLSCIYYVDCNGVCGGDWIYDECGNCYDYLVEGYDIVFYYTGDVQTFDVPQNVGSLFIEAYGAQGGDGGPATSGQGGLGGYASGVFNVTPGQTLYVYVGGKGQDATLFSEFGGWNGGGGTNAKRDDGKRPGCGGGASDIRTSFSLDSRIIVAGGGGGASGWTSGDGGYGGGLEGQQGQGPYFEYGYPGEGGTQSQGGYGHVESGTFGLGGRGHGGGHGGGGGGGGFYGGGGGLVDSGGGGSSFIDGVNEGETGSAVQSGSGIIIFTWVNVIPVCVLGCVVEQACNFNPEATNDDGTCDFCFCGPGTAWDNLSEQCLIVEGSSDIDGDGCTNLSDLLDLLSDYGICDE